MRSPFGGYTLIEVLIFVAISSVLLAITMVVFRGQHAHTEFVTGMNDVNTKMQQWVNQVVNGYSGAQSLTPVSDYNCTVPNAAIPTSSPELTVVAPGAGTDRGSNPECIFLGKALQVNDNNAPDPHKNYIYAYTLIGRRTHTPVGATEPTIVNNILNARPVAAVFPPGASPPAINLTETFRVPYGMRVLSTKMKNAAGADINNSHLAGIFTGFNSEASANLGSPINDNTNGALSLIGVQYPFVNNVNDPVDINALDCLNLTGPSCSTPPGSNLWPMQVWEICFQNSRNEERALLAVRSTNGFGVSTNLTIGGAALCT